MYPRRVCGPEVIPENGDVPTDQAVGLVERSGPHMSILKILGDREGQRVRHAQMHLRPGKEILERTLIFPHAFPVGADGVIGRRKI